MKLSVVSLSNNHIMDFGVEGLEDTIEILERFNILHVGAGMNESEARKPAIVSIGGLRVAFLAYTLIDVSGRHEVQYADTNKPGVAKLRISNIEEDLGRLADVSNIRVVSLHWGNDPIHYPRPYHKIVAHRILNCGADVILGHHAHLLKGIDFTSRKLIAYDLGNFLFPNFNLDRDDVIQYFRANANRYWDWNSTMRTSVALETSLGKEGVQNYHIYPIQLFRGRPFVSTLGPIRSALLKRKSEAWSEPLTSSSYKELYKRIVGLPRGSIWLFVKAVIEHVRVSGLTSAFKRVVHVILEWRALRSQN